MELETERMKPESERWRERVSTHSTLKTPTPATTSLTSVAARMQQQLQQSVDMSATEAGEGVLASEGEKDTLYKKWQEHLKTLFCNERIDAAMMYDIDRCLDELVATVNDLTMEILFM